MLRPDLPALGLDRLNRFLTSADESVTKLNDDLKSGKENPV